MGPKGEYERCSYRWTGKDCPHCGEKNDISARYCYVCKGELVDPGKKLIADFRAMKKNPTIPQTDEILSMETKESISTKGNATIRADFVTPYRQFSVWYMKNPSHSRAARDLEIFNRATIHGKPKTVSYVKDSASGFFRVLAFNAEPDMVQERLG